MSITSHMHRTILDKYLTSPDELTLWHGEFVFCLILLESVHARIYFVSFDFDFRSETSLTLYTIRRPFARGFACSQIFGGARQVKNP